MWRNGRRISSGASNAASNMPKRQQWRFLSWNVNGLRAAEKKGFAGWLGQCAADIVAVQETKARPEQLSEALLRPPRYRADWNSAEKKGYSGVVTYSKL